MQTIIPLPSCRLLVFDVPEDSSNIELRVGFAGYSDEDVIVTYDTPRGVGTEFIDVPGNWQILGKYPSGITEEQAKGLVENVTSDFWMPSYNDPDSGGMFGPQYYKDYQSKNGEEACWTAYQSLHSLIMQNGCKAEKKYCLLIEKL